MPKNVGSESRFCDGLSRRAWLQMSGLALGGLALAANGLASPRSRLSPGEVQERIRGPILTVPTPFTAEFAVDDTAVRRSSQDSST